MGFEFLIALKVVSKIIVFSVLIGWASIPKVVASIPTVARHIFQACPVLLIIDY
jgi:hypothetical protein